MVSSSINPLSISQPRWYYVHQRCLPFSLNDEEGGTDPFTLPLCDDGRFLAGASTLGTLFASFMTILECISSSFAALTFLGQKRVTNLEQLVSRGERLNGWFLRTSTNVAASARCPRRSPFSQLRRLRCGDQLRLMTPSISPPCHL